MALGREVHLAGERLDEAGEQAGAVAHLVGGGWWSASVGPPGSVVVACDPTSRGVAVPTPIAARRPWVTYALLAVAVVAVSTSAPLIAGADAPTLAIAFWRNALSLPVLAACGCSPAATERAGLASPVSRATAGCRACRACSSPPTSRRGSRASRSPRSRRRSRSSPPNRCGRR